MLITLNEWSDKYGNPSNVFYDEIGNIISWASLPVSFTPEMLWTYLLHKYGGMLMRDYELAELTFLTSIWHHANEYKFAGLAATTQLDYNPIENYNRTETETSERTPDISREIETTETPRVVTSQQSTRTPNVTETDNHNLMTTEGGTTANATTGTNSETSGVTGKVAPFDSAIFNNASQNDVTASGSGSSSETITHGKTTADTGTLTHTTAGTDTTQTTTTHTGENRTSRAETETGTDTTERTAHISGNIGVTTSQQMIEQERAIVNYIFLDVYLSAWIVEFCAGVWTSEI